MQLAGKKILITGAARGLGRCFASEAARAGAHVVLADILDAEARMAAVEIEAEGGAAAAVPLDLADGESIRRCVNEAIAEMGGLDGLVNNGAIATGIGGPFMEEIEIEVWDHVMAVNDRGTFLMTRAAAPALRASAGRVVNIASDTPLWGAPGLMHYVASKGAVIAMTRAMARELGRDNVTVNAVAPGLTRVEATASVSRERHALYESGRALSRPQLPEDTAGTVLFLLSDAARFTTGQLIVVNGGFVMH